MWRPFGNDTSLPPAAWHPEPTFRGSYAVLSTCLFTMSLCIWTSVHLNLPEHKKSHQQVWRKTGWLVMGLLAPEIVAWNAWEQRRDVKRLTKRMHELHARRFHYPRERPTCWQIYILRFPRKLKSGSWCKTLWHKMRVALLFEPGELCGMHEEPYIRPSDKETFSCPWTDVHSWYTAMGGFVFDTASAEEQFLPEGRERVVCSTEGMALLAERWPHLVPRISVESIVDRSKSDGLSKFITCWQAGWFCIQCIFRLHSGLSISLLELNVFGHAISALCIYMIWWTKPKDIQEPTAIGGDCADEELHSVAAMFALMSPIGYAIRRSRKGWFVDPFQRYIKHYMWIPAEQDTLTRELPPLAESLYSVQDLAKPRSIVIRGKCWTLEDIDEGEYEPDDSETSEESEPEDTEEPEGKPTEDWQSETTSESTTTMNDRRLMQSAPRRARATRISIDQRTAARLAMVQTPALLSQMQDAAKHKWKFRGGHMISYRLDPLVSSRNRNWCLNLHMTAKVPNFSKFSDLTAVTLATSLYGGLHVTAWYAAYPSRAELLLWRCSSLTVALTGPGLATLTLFVVGIALLASYRSKLAFYRRLQTWLILYGVARPTLRRWLHVVMGVFSFPFLLVILLALFALPVWYFFARGFLVVESFINIAHLSRAVLSVPAWSQYLPHVT